MNLKTFIFGLALTFGIPWLALVVLPHADMRGLEGFKLEDDDAEKYGMTYYPPGRPGFAAAGHAIYAREQCSQCHTQVIRPTYAGNDGWKLDWANKEGATAQSPVFVRHTLPHDYEGEPYAHLGSQRLGPDLANYGTRNRTANDIHLRLYRSRMFSKWSNMPDYDHLYEKQTIRGQGTDDALQFPKGEAFDKYAPEEGFEIVPTDEARTLVAYLMGLNKSQPIPPSISGIREAEAKKEGGDAKKAAASAEPAK